jgi:hypothetical protein
MVSCEGEDLASDHASPAREHILKKLISFPKHLNARKFLLTLRQNLSFFNMYIMVSQNKSQLVNEVAKTPNSSLGKRGFSSWMVNVCQLEWAMGCTDFW